MFSSSNTVYQRDNNGVMRKAEVHFIKHNNKCYLKKEDIIDIILDMSVTEEHDVKTRFTQLALNIGKIGT